jgi:hypothetical protein
MNPYYIIIDEEYEQYAFVSGYDVRPGQSYLTYTDIIEDAYEFVSKHSAEEVLRKLRKEYAYYNMVDHTIVSEAELVALAL